MPPGHCDIKGNGTSWHIIAHHGTSIRIITTHVGPSEAQAATSFTLGNACGLVLGGGARMGRREMVLTGLVVAIGSSLLLLVASRRCHDCHDAAKIVEILKTYRPHGQMAWMR